MLALLRKEHPDGVDAIIEIHRRQPSKIATRYFRASGFAALGLYQMILPFVPFDFFSRFSFALLRYLRSQGSRRVIFNYNQLLIYPVLSRSLLSDIVVHDVMYDMWRSSTGPRRLFWRQVRFWESFLVQSLPKISTLVFLSEKDRLLLSHCYRCNVRVLNLPELLSTNYSVRRSSRKQSMLLAPGVRVGLLGAWNRPENSNGAISFFNSLDPSVLEGLIFLIAGQGAERLPDGKSIQKLGFVGNLDVFFSQIDIFIAPLDSGAGVKIKVLDALDYGVPMFLTSNACQGIDLPEDYPCIVEDNCIMLAKHFNHYFVHP